MEKKNATNPPRKERKTPKKSSGAKLTIRASSTKSNNNDIDSGYILKFI